MSSVQYGSQPPYHPVSSTQCFATELYHVSEHNARSARGALVDRGANGGILGIDARVTHIIPNREVDVTGIDNHEMNSLKIVNATAKVITQRGPVILILHQYAYHGLSRTIHSSGQIEAHGNHVDDRSFKTGGKQCIRTLDGYIIPIDIINGLPYIKMVPNTDQDLLEYPSVVFTSGVPWKPKSLDCIISDTDDWYNNIKQLSDGLIKTPFDEYGNYMKREPTTAPTEVPSALEGAEEFSGNFMEAYHLISNLNQVYFIPEGQSDDFSLYEAEQLTADAPKQVTTTVPRETVKKPIDYERYRPYFLHVPIEKIRKTFERTTQHASNVVSGHHIQQTIRSPYPALNRHRRSEPVATDTIYSETAAVNTGGQKHAQVYVGRKSLVIDVYGMKSDKEFVNTLEDVIRKRGAMDKLISDHSQTELSARVLDILRALCIDNWQSEANYQHQNFAEQRWKFLKKNTQWFMNFRNVRSDAWLLCLQWVADIMNHTAEKSLSWRPPLQVLTGQTIDISILLCFLFWDIVYCSRYKDKEYKNQVGSQKSSEVRGRFVGFAWSVGHALTFKILVDGTNKILERSQVRLALEGENNLKLDTAAGAVPERIYITSKRNVDDDKIILPTIDVSLSPFFVNDQPIVDTPPDPPLIDPVDPSILKTSRPITAPLDKATTFTPSLPKIPEEHVPLTPVVHPAPPTTTNVLGEPVMQSATIVPGEQSATVPGEHGMPHATTPSKIKPKSKVARPPTRRSKRVLDL